MLGKFRELKHEAQRVRAIYNPRSVEDLEDVATNEFGCVVVRSPFFLGKSIAVRNMNAGKNYIFYDGVTEDGRRHELSHEIGHVVAGHLLQKESLRSPSWLREIEANYFGKHLNGFSALQRQLIAQSELVGAWRRMAIGMPPLEDEIDRLRLMLQPDLLSYLTRELYIPQLASPQQQ
jgi:hypothetical protein